METSSGRPLDSLQQSPEVVGASAEPLTDDPAAAAARWTSVARSGHPPTAIVAMTHVDSGCYSNVYKGVTSCS